jgi:heat shock protein HtpX
MTCALRITRPVIGTLVARTVRHFARSRILLSGLRGGSRAGPDLDNQARRTHGAAIPLLAMWNQLKTIVLFGVLSALFVAIGGAFAPRYLFVFLAFALAMNAFAYFYSDRIVLAMYRAQEVTPAQAPELHAVVRELAIKAGIPVPRVCIIADDQPNAFATGRNPEHAVVAVTDGILRALDRRELRGVLAHELSHIKNRDILISTVAAVLASAITTIANVLSFGAMFGSRSDDDRGGSMVGGLAMIIVAPLAAMLVQLAISRSRELGADERGARLTGDPDGLASALIRLDRAAHVLRPAHAGAPATSSLFIVNPFGALDHLSRWFSTHPSLEERVARLRALQSPRQSAYAH